MTDGYRKAALKLHGVSAPDRAWMLQRLPAEQRDRLCGLLRELRALGIEPDRQLADHISDEEVRQALLQAGSAVSGLPDALDALCAARAKEMSDLLASEPDSVAVAVLSVYPWPWRARLLADFGMERHHRISRSLLQAPQLKPRLRAEMVKALADRLATLRADYPAFDELVARDGQPGSRSEKVTFMQGLRRWLP